MKKLIVFIVNAAVLFGTGNATLGAANQESGENCIYYVEVYESVLMGAKSVCINYGVNALLGKYFKIIGEDGNPIDFENALGALNYLGRQGWEQVSVYEREMKSAGRRTFYLLRLDGTKYAPTLITEATDAAI